MKQIKLEGLRNHAHEEATVFLTQGSSLIYSLVDIYHTMATLDHPTEEAIQMSSAVVTPQQVMLLMLSDRRQGDILRLLELVEAGKFGNSQDNQRMHRGLLYASYLSQMLDDIMLSMAVPDTESSKRLLGMCEFALSNFLYGFTNTLGIGDISTALATSEPMSFDADIQKWVESQNLDIMALTQTYTQLRSQFIPTVEASLEFPQEWSQFQSMIPAELFDDVSNVADFIYYPDIQAVLGGKVVIDDDFVAIINRRSREQSVFSRNVDSIAAFVLRIPAEHYDILIKYGEGLTEAMMTDVIAGRRDVDDDFVKELASSHKQTVKQPSIADLQTKQFDKLGACKDE